MDEAKLSAGDIRRIQEQAWAKNMAHVLTRSAFYREHLARSGFRPDRPPPLDALPDIPPIEKRILSERTDDFVCVSRGDVVEIVTTSGTTGRALVVPMTESDVQRLAYNETLSFRCAGLTAGDTVLLGVTLDRCFIAGMAYALGLRQLGCAVVRVGASAPEMHFDMIDRLKPTAIVSVPSFLRVLADRAGETGRDLVRAGVSRAICIGEPLRGPDLTSNAAADDIMKRWGACVFSTYGNTELEGSLCECEAGQGGHAHPELMLVEALDEAGRPVGEGEVGEITATTFGVQGLPLIRYRTGDFAAIYTAPCACGRVTPRIGPVVGRKHQKLKVKGSTIYPSTLQAVLDSCPGVAGYVILARSESPLSDSIEVLIHCSLDVDSTIGRLREAFRGRAKVVPAIRNAARTEIEALQMPEGVRKRRFFVDLRESSS